MLDNNAVAGLFLQRMCIRPHTKPYPLFSLFVIRRPHKETDDKYTCKMRVCALHKPLLFDLHQLLMWSQVDGGC